LLFGVAFQEEWLMARFFGAREVAVGVALCLAMVLGPSAARAGTVVHFDTSLGSFDVELYDSAAPVTVANFLNYVNGGQYQDTFIHRSVPGFIIQGGGFAYDQPHVEATDFPEVLNDPPIVNEFDPTRSNIRGTIAMAKTSDPNSATSQFFFNLADNSSSLDNPANSGGFTVFGCVVGDGMAVVDAIAGVSIFNFSNSVSTVFGELPLRNYTQDDYYNYVAVTDDNVVLVNVALPEPGTLVLLAAGAWVVVRRRQGR
jgi:peptidyl-prolyl cis-trans isomerase A (cyclophilin A)